MKNWITVLSKEVIDVRDGTHDSPKYAESGYPLITSKNLKKGIISFENVNYIKEEDYININKRSKVDKGDILYSMIGSIGNYALVKEEPIFAIKNVALFKFKDERLFHGYFIHLLNSTIINRQIKSAQRGGTQKFVSLKILRSLKIPLPPLPTQKKIAAILDEADRLRQLNQQVLNKYDAFGQSLFLDMFGDPVVNPKGWEKQKLSTIADILTGFAFKSKDYLDDSTQIRLLGGINIMIGKLDWERVNFWSKEKIKGLDKYFLEQNDIVVAMDRPWIKGGFKIAKITKNDLPSLLIQRTTRIRCKEEYYSTFIYQVLNHKAFYLHCNTTETTVPHISPKDFKAYEVFIPPLQLVKDFATQINSIETQKSQAQAALKKSEDLFNGLLQRAFKGELVE